MAEDSADLLAVGFVAPHHGSHGFHRPYVAAISKLSSQRDNDGLCLVSLLLSCQSADMFLNGLPNETAPRRELFHLLYRKARLGINETLKRA